MAMDDPGHNRQQVILGVDTHAEFARGRGIG
jgi:hypothetical protein